MDLEVQVKSLTLKRSAFQSITELLLRVPELWQYATDWFSTLPKQLWQLKSANPQFSFEIAKFTSEYLKGGYCSQYDLGKFAGALCPTLVSHQAQKSIFGPFVSYPPNLQNCFLDMLFYLPAWPQPLIASLFTVAIDQRISASVVARLLDIIDTRQVSQLTRMNPDALSGFKISIFQGYPSANLLRNSDFEYTVYHTDVSDASWQKRLDLISHRSNMPTEPEWAECILDRIKAGVPLDVFLTLGIIYTNLPTFDINAVCCALLNACPVAALALKKHSRAIFETLDTIVYRTLAIPANREIFYKLLAENASFGKKNAMQCIDTLSILLFQNAWLHPSQADIKVEIQEAGAIILGLDFHGEDWNQSKEILAGLMII